MPQVSPAAPIHPLSRPSARPPPLSQPPSWLTFLPHEVERVVEVRRLVPLCVRLAVEPRAQPAARAGRRRRHLGRCLVHLVRVLPLVRGPGADVSSACGPAGGATAAVGTCAERAGRARLVLDGTASCRPVQVGHLVGIGVEYQVEVGT